MTLERTQSRILKQVLTGWTSVSHSEVFGHSAQSSAELLKTRVHKNVAAIQTLSGVVRQALDDQAKQADSLKTQIQSLREVTERASDELNTVLQRVETLKTSVDNTDHALSIRSARLKFASHIEEVDHLV